VENVDDDGDEVDDHFVYGELESEVLDLTTRLNVIFTRDLSLEFYAQPFVAAGDYGHFKELDRPESHDFIPYTGLVENPDFHRRSLRSNLVLRWEYRPGSTFFFVWSQSRRIETEEPSLRPLSSLGHSLTDDGTNILLVKLNYWVGL